MIPPLPLLCAFRFSHAGYHDTCLSIPTSFVVCCDAIYALCARIRVLPNGKKEEKRRRPINVPPPTHTHAQTQHVYIFAVRRRGRIHIVHRSIDASVSSESNQPAFPSFSSLPSTSFSSFWCSRFPHSSLLLLSPVGFGCRVEPDQTLAILFFSLSPSSLPAHLSRHIRRRRPDKTWSCQFHFFVLCPI